MTLNDASLISQVVSAIVVVLTLVVLIISIRQNTRAQRAVSVGSLTAAIAAINVPAMQSHELGEAVAAARADWWSATREQRIVAHYFLFSLFKLWEQAFYQHRAGVLDESQWAGWETMVTNYYHSPGIFGAWWPQRKSAYSREFQAYLAETTKAAEIGDLGDIFGPRPVNTKPEAPQA